MQQPPQITFRRKEKGGVNLQCAVPQSELDLDLCKLILAEYKIHNADILLKYDSTADDLIDIVEGNRVYVPCIYLLNKIGEFYDFFIKWQFPMTNVICKLFLNILEEFK